MKQTEEQYANELIEKYKFVYIPNYTSMFEVIQCAIIDVENTIEALSGMKLIFSDRELVLKYYQNVLQILKDKLI